MSKYKTARASLLLPNNHQQPAFSQPTEIISKPSVVKQEKTLEHATELLNMKLQTVAYKSSADPAFWGPAFWFSLHNGAARYPKEATTFCAQKMKGFIGGMPYIIPCENCSEHCRAYIDSKQDQLDDICSERGKLFNFFVDLHNIVNKRYGKSEMSYADAMALYTTNNPTLTKMTY
jgi:hypothetical protein